MKKIKSFEIVTMALYNLGGSTKNIHTEDIAIEADKSDPERFKWRKYKENIDLGLIFDCLKSAKNRKLGSYLKGNDEKGWSLTKEGLEFCLNTKNNFSNKLVRKKRVSKIEKKYLIREENRIKNSDAYIKFLNGEANISETDIKNLFKIDDYSTKEDVEKRINNVLDNFTKNKKIFLLIEKYKQQAMEIISCH